MNRLFLVAATLVGLTVAQTPDPCTVDLMIVMDVSGSITEDTDFVNEKNFIIDVLKFPSPAWYRAERLNVGIVKFTSTADVLLPLQESTRESAVQTMQELTSIGGQTSALSGVRLALRRIRENRRPGATTVMVLVSDGNSGESDPLEVTKAVGKELAAEGIVVFAMTYSTDAYVEELRAYAGSPDRVYHGNKGVQERRKFERDINEVTRNLAVCGAAPEFGPVTTPTFAKFNPCLIDLMVVMDVSGSITEDTDFENEKKFIIDTLEFPSPAWYRAERLKVGIVNFTDTASILLPFEESTRAKAVDTMRALTSKGGRTSAMSGMRLALKEIRRNRRPDAQVVIVLVSDGNSGVQDELIEVKLLGRELAREGVMVFAFTYSTDAYRDELLAYSLSSDRVYHGDKDAGAFARFERDIHSVVRNVDKCGLVQSTPATLPPAPLPPATQPPVTAAGDPCIVDLMIVMDVSSSIVFDDDFQNEKSFVLKVLQMPSAAWYRAGRLNVGLVTFTSSAKSVLKLESSDRQTTIDTVTALQSRGGSTSAMSGMNLAMSQIRTTRRQGATSVLLLVSDGNSGVTDSMSEVRKLGRQIADENIVVFAMTYSTDAYENELVAYAGDVDRVYHGNRGQAAFDKFERDIETITRNIKKCGPAN